MVFGSRSEKLAAVVADQLALDLADVATDVTLPAAANDDHVLDKPAGAAGKPRKKAQRNIGALPKHLPRCEQVIEPETTACPCCQGLLHKIGQDVSEVLDVIPAILRVLRMIRPKYACRGCEGAVVQAKALPRLIENSMASTALVTHVVVSKFAWFSTLYRQVQILAGHGVHLDRSTLAGWVKRTAWWLKGLYELQLRTIHAAPLFFCDETRMPVLDPGRGRTKTCQFWAHAVDDRPWSGPSPPAVAYVFADGRGKGEIAAQLVDYAGILQVDGYVAYKSLAKDAREAGTIRLAFCLAHCTTKVRESLQDDEVAVRSGSDRAHRSDLRYRGTCPGHERRDAIGCSQERDQAADGGIEDAADRGAQGHLVQIPACGGHQLYAGPLGWADRVPD
jgi:transposase